MYKDNRGFRLIFSIVSEFKFRIRLENGSANSVYSELPISRKMVMYSWTHTTYRSLVILVLLLNIVQITANYTSPSYLPLKIKQPNMKNISTEDTSWQQNFSIPTSTKYPGSSSISPKHMLVKFFMRSQRKRRSLEYYMSVDEKFALQIQCKLRIHSTVYRLSVSDSGKAQINPATSPGDKMVISVISDTSKLMSSNVPDQLFRPEDNVSVVIRRFNSSVFLCMTPDGLVVTERMINHTISDNCEWRLRISRHGYGFERTLSSEPNPVGNVSLTYERLALGTLSVYRNGDFHLAPGWMHKLWQPEATWLVYQAEINKLERNKDQLTTNEHEDDSQTGGASTESAPNDESDIIRLGQRDVYTQDATAYDMEVAYTRKQRKHCNMITRNLTLTVQQEILDSVNIMSKLRSSLLELNQRLETNPSMFNSNTLEHLVHRWLILINARWERKIVNGLNSTQFAVNCSQFSWTKVLSESDRSLRHSFEKLYHDMFLKLQHLAKWSWRERRRWLQRPRLASLFRYLELKIPSTSRIIQSMQILKRYYNLTLSDRDIDLLINPTSLLKQIRNVEELKRILSRAMWLKFEELLFWPNITEYTKNGHSKSPNMESLQNAVSQLPKDSLCFIYLYNIWQNQRQALPPQKCSLDHLFIVTQNVHILK